MESIEKQVGYRWIVLSAGCLAICSIYMNWRELHGGYDGARRAGGISGISLRDYRSISIVSIIGAILSLFLRRR